MADKASARITIRVHWLMCIPGPSSWPRPLLGLAHFQVGVHHDLMLYVLNRDIKVHSWNSPAPSPTVSA